MTVGIEIKPENYYVGFWFTNPGKAENRQVDMMGCIWQEKDGPWKATYRFRYYNKDSQHAFDQKDEKSWYGFEFPADASDEEIEKVKEGFDLIFQMTADRNESKFEFHEVDGDGMKAMKILKDAPFTHFQTFEQHEMN